MKYFIKGLMMLGPFAYAVVAYANLNIVVMMNKKSEITALTTSQLQAYYKAQMIKLPNGGRIRLCSQKDNRLRADFYKSIGVNEDEAFAQLEQNNAKSVSTGQSQNEVRLKEVSSNEDVENFLKRNPEGGICYCTQEEFMILNKNSLVKQVYP